MWRMVSGVTVILTLAALPPLPKKLVRHPVVDGIAFAEGPAFDSKGNLYFVNYQRNGTIGRRTPDGKVSVWVELPPPGFAFGLKTDAHDNLLAADMDGKRLLRIAPDKTITTLAEGFEGKPFRGLNDLCLDRAGNIFFTDPNGSDDHNLLGAVYRYSTAGKLTRVQTGLAYPNGLVVSADQKRLYVGETALNRLLAFDLAADGTLSNNRVLHQFPNFSVDGMRVDAQGRIWIARLANNSVDVLSEAGELLASYPVGKQATNVAWWGKQLYVTLANEHAIVRFDVGVREAK
jgi:gluconolactonase